MMTATSEDHSTTYTQTVDTTSSSCSTPELPNEPPSEEQKRRLTSLLLRRNQIFGLDQSVESASEKPTESITLTDELSDDDSLLTRQTTTELWISDIKHVEQEHLIERMKRRGVPPAATSDGKAQPRKVQFALADNCSEDEDDVEVDESVKVKSWMSAQLLRDTCRGGHLLRGPEAVAQERSSSQPSKQVRFNVNPLTTIDAASSAAHRLELLQQRFTTVLDVDDIEEISLRDDSPPAAYLGKRSSPAAATTSPSKKPPSIPSPSSEVGIVSNSSIVTSPEDIEARKAQSAPCTVEMTIMSLSLTSDRLNKKKVTCSAKIRGILTKDKSNNRLFETQKTEVLERAAYFSGAASTGAKVLDLSKYDGGYVNGVVSLKLKEIGSIVDTDIAVTEYPLALLYEGISLIPVLLFDVGTGEPIGTAQLRANVSGFEHETTYGVSSLSCRAHPVSTEESQREHNALNQLAQLMFAHCGTAASQVYHQLTTASLENKGALHVLHEARRLLVPDQIAVFVGLVKVSNVPAEFHGKKIYLRAEVLGGGISSAKDVVANTKYNFKRLLRSADRPCCENATAFDEWLRLEVPQSNFIPKDANGAGGAQDGTNYTSRKPLVLLLTLVQNGVMKDHTIGSMLVPLKAVVEGHIPAERRLRWPLVPPKSHIKKWQEKVGSEPLALKHLPSVTVMVGFGLGHAALLAQLQDQAVVANSASPKSPYNLSKRRERDWNALVGLDGITEDNHAAVFNFDVNFHEKLNSFC